MLLLGSVGGETGNQEHTRGGCSLGRMHLTVKREGMVEETRIIFPRESKLGVGGNAGCSELQHLNRSASSGPTAKALMASGRWRVSRFWLWSSSNFQ